MLAFASLANQLPKEMEKEKEKKKRKRKKKRDWSDRMMHFTVQLPRGHCGQWGFQNNNPKERRFRASHSQCRRPERRIVPSRSGGRPLLWMQHSEEMLSHPFFKTPLTSEISNMTWFSGSNTIASQVWHNEASKNSSFSTNSCGKEEATIGPFKICAVGSPAYLHSESCGRLQNPAFWLLERGRVLIWGLCPGSLLNLEIYSLKYQHMKH